MALTRAADSLGLPLTCRLRREALTEESQAMPFTLVAAPGKTLTQTYKDEAYISPVTGETECVAFLQAKLDGIGPTTGWVEGDKIRKLTDGEAVPKAGTAIATFVSGKYPGPGKKKHAAIYLGQDKDGIQVLDQWASQGKVLPRTIRWKVTAATTIQNDGNKYSIIETAATKGK